MTRVGSLCTGYGGLDMAATAVFGGTAAWHADNHPASARLLAHRWPDVPNHGDLTAIDWAQVEPVDVLTAGFPCQDLSYAGRGAGIVEGTRSGLWYAIADAIGVLRPGLFIAENVAAIVTRRPGLDVVLGGLAELGFDADWTCVRASDVGAPHRRDRWFCVAWPADTARPGLEGGREGRATRGAAADDPGDGRREGWTEPARLEGRPDPAIGGDAAAHTDGDAVRQQPVPDTGCSGPAVAGFPGSGWGVYRRAVDRWAAVLGRPAPAPTQPSRTGRPQLAPPFVEWLMGLPAGHVTGVPGLTRSEQLHLLGNGVVPQQATAALTALASASLGAAA